MNSNDIKQLGTILTVWAHPDDESFLVAGVVQQAIENGQRVACVTATRGEKGSQDEQRWPSATLGKVRAAELGQALQILGVTEHYWLDFIDGECHLIDDTAAVEKLLPIYESVKPDTILTFDPHGLTGHPDHQCASRWAKLAADKTKLSKRPQIYYVVDSLDWYENGGRELDEKFNIFFATDTPTLLPEKDIEMTYELNPEQLDRKIEALRAQTSQTESMFDSMAPSLRQMLAREYFVTETHEITRPHIPRKA